MSTNCQSCIYSAVQLDAQSHQAGGLICRAIPPTPQAIAVPTPQGISVQILTLWPVVKKDDVCAMHDNGDAD